MSRRFDNMTEEEAREELARRNDPRQRHRDEPVDPGFWSDPYGFAAGPMGGMGYGWPFPPGHDRQSPQGAPWADPRGRYRAQYAGQYRGQDGSHERDFMDRAGDEIASWFGNEDATARREADHRGRGPKGYVRSDARIEEDVNDHLTEHPRVDASDISVSVKDREITLDGTVSSRQAKRCAEDCADRVTGVQHVQNNLRIQTAQA